MKWRAIIFDLDGTLLDSLKDLALSFNAVLLQWGYREHPVGDYRRFIGDGIEALAERALPPGEPGRIGPEAFAGFLDAARREYSRRWADHTRPYPGIAALLDFLEHREIPMAIFSNKPHEFTVATVERFLARWHFTAVQGAQRGVPRKPDPAGVLAVSRTLGVAPRETVYLGDSGMDMVAAFAAGMLPVGALWGFRHAGELLDGGAAYLAGHPRDLRPFFDGACPDD